MLSPGALLHQIDYHWRRRFNPLDPTFGKTDIGASSYNNFNWNSKYGCRFQAPEDGIITELSFYGYTFRAGTYTCYLCVYSDVNGVPDALLGYGSVDIGDAPAAWHTVTGLNIPITAGTYYWLAANWGWTGMACYYDDGVTNQWAEQAEGADSPPPDDTFGTVLAYQPWEMSIYATYTVPVVPGVKAMYGGLYLVSPF